MELRFLISIIRFALMFMILITGITSVIVNERKRRLITRRGKHEMLVHEIEKKRGCIFTDNKLLKPAEINTLSAIIALKVGFRSLAFLLGILSILLILIEFYGIIKGNVL